MARLTIVVLAFVAAPLAGCLDFSVPQRNIQAVSHDVIPVTDAMQRLETDNPNRARVGSQFRIRIFRDGQREPVHTATGSDVAASALNRARAVSSAIH